MISKGYRRTPLVGCNLKTFFKLALLSIILAIIVPSVSAVDANSAPISHTSSQASAKSSPSSTSTKKTTSQADIVPGISRELFNEINKLATQNALKGLQDELKGESSLLETSSTVKIDSYKGVKANTFNSGDLSMNFVNDVIKQTQKKGVPTHKKDVDLNEFMGQDYFTMTKKTLNKVINPISFLEIESQIQQTGDFFPSLRDIADMLGFEDAKKDGQVNARSPVPPTPQVKRAAYAPPPPPTRDASKGPSLMEQSSTAQARTQARGQAQSTASTQAHTKAREGGESYEAPTAPPSFTDWLNGQAPGAGETAEDLGFDYKPDPRRHPPPPPVPSPPPPPPPPSFSSESPMAAFAFKEKNTGNKKGSTSQPAPNANNPSLNGFKGKTVNGVTPITPSPTPTPASSSSPQQQTQAQKQDKTSNGPSNTPVNLISLNERMKQLNNIKFLNNNLKNKLSNTIRR